MLITFTCDAHESIVMFGDVGYRLLEMMGYNKKSSGLIHVEDIPVVRSRLRSAIDNNKAGQTMRLDANENTNELESNEPKVSLEQRVFPLFEMLDAAEKEKCEVKWTSSS